MTTGFVLSGGGSLGAIQVGMLQAMADLQIKPDLLVGTSAGALNASYIAGHGTEPSSLKGLVSVWRGLRTSILFRPDPLRLSLALIGRDEALFSATNLRRLIKKHLTFTNLEDSPIPLWVVTTDLLTGLEVHHDSGPALELITASAAIPGIFAPVKYDGNLLVDGSLANDSAISVAVANGADTVYVLPTGHPCALAKPPQSAVGVAVQAASVLIHQQLLRDIRVYADQCDLIVLPPPCPLAISPLDFGHADLLIKQGRLDATKALAKDGGRHHDPAKRIAAHKH